MIKENPYSLIGFVRALEFKIVDDIGKQMGVSLDNETRVDTGILYAINKITEFGHTCTLKQHLIEYATNILEVQEQDIVQGIQRLIMEEKLYLQIIEEEECVFRKSFYLAEDNIAQGVVYHVMQGSSNKSYEKEINTVSKMNDIELSEEQKVAIATCLNNAISVITGGPGTGKTTIIKCIIDILELTKKDYVLCAPTGRAAKRIKETTGKEAKTLHRLLEITKMDDKDMDMFIDFEVKPIEADVVIVDESSMIDCMMMNNLMKAVKSSTQIILVGDINQLPSVGPGCVLKDIIESQVVSVVYLKQIYRQSAMSDIVVNAHRVNEGEHPEFKTKDTDLFFVKANSMEQAISEISSLVSYRLETFAKFDVMKDLQVLTPMKKTELGTIQLNSILQGVLNPSSASKEEKEYNGKCFRQGDKVMQIINNYDKKFALNGEYFEGIYNGDIGFIQKIDVKQEKLWILFDDEKEVEYDFEELEQIEHAYAVTIHKSQGSEFDYVILPVLAGYPKLFTRNLLYTAMTRAKKMLVIVGNKQVINFMVDNVDFKNRKTGLRYKILDKI